MAAVTAEHPTALIIDLDAVTFLDSGGVGTLIHGRRIADAHAVRYRVINPRGHVRDVLALMGLLQYLLTGEAP